MRPQRLAGRAAGLLTWALLAGCTSSVAGGPVGTLVPAEDRTVAPQAAGPALGGTRLDTGAYAGQVLVVNFWASWCVPCRTETKGLEQVWHDTASRGVQFIGVDIRDSRTAAENFRRSHSVDYPSLYDEDGSVLAAFRQVPPTAIPSTLLIDRQGRVAARFIGAVTPEQLEPLVLDLSHDPRPSTAGSPVPAATGGASAPR